MKRSQRLLAVVLMCVALPLSMFVSAQGAGFEESLRTLREAGEPFSEPQLKELQKAKKEAQVKFMGADSSKRREEMLVGTWSVVATMTEKGALRLPKTILVLKPNSAYMMECAGKNLHDQGQWKLEGPTLVLEPKEGKQMVFDILVTHSKLWMTPPPREDTWLWEKVI